MWNFSDDEWLFFFAAAAIVVVGGVRYYRPLLSIPLMNRSHGRRAVLALLPVVAVVPTCVVLNRWADARVVGHLGYSVLFIVGGLAWVFAAAELLGVLGVSIRDDVLERDNTAALIAVSGMLLGVGVVYALCNIGSGPTIWTTILPAPVATALLVGLAILVELLGATVADAVTIDRDIATALRVGGVALGGAVILGRAGAGDWISWPQTWADMAAHGWPAVVLAIAAGGMHRLLRPNAARPRPPIFQFGIVPAVLLLAASILVTFIA